MDAGTQIKRQQRIGAAGRQADRQRRQRPVVGAETLLDGAFLHAEETAQRALGLAGGPRRVQHDRGAVLPLRRIGRCVCQKVRQARQSLRGPVADGDDVVHHGPEQIGMVERRLAQKQGCAVRAGDHLGHDLGRDAIVDRCGDRAQPCHRHIGGKEIGMVLRDHRHFVARSDAAPRQHRHHPFHPVEEIRIGLAPPLEHHRGFRGEPPRVQPQGLEKGHRHGRLLR